MAGPFFVIRVNYNIKCNTCGQKKGSYRDLVV